MYSIELCILIYYNLYMFIIFNVNKIFIYILKIMDVLNN